MYRGKYNNFSFFKLIIIAIIIIYLFMFIYIFKTYVKNDKKEKIERLKIINIKSDGLDHFSILNNIYREFGDTFIINGLYAFPKDDKQQLKRNVRQQTPPPTDDKKKKHKHIVLYGNQNKQVTSLPFLSPNKTSQFEDEIFINGYKSSVNVSGDFVLINDNLTTPNNYEISWCASESNSFIQERTTDNTFLRDKEVVINGENKHFSHLIVTRYLVNNSPALHVNYIVKKKGMNEQNIISFIKFLNYIEKIITQEKIFYFSIAGDAHINSAKWRKIAYKIFKNSIYISPGVESRFLTDNAFKYGAQTTNFIIVSKLLAPFGVYFYLSKTKIDYFSSYFTLVAEILNSENDNAKSLKDDTDLIYQTFLKEKEIDPSIRLDMETSNEFNLTKFDFNEIGEYEPNKRSVKIYHINDIVQNYINEKF